MTTKKNIHWAIEDKKADEKDLPHVYAGKRKNGRKWKYLVDVDGIYIDNREKRRISEEGASKIFEKARELDEEAQTPDSARYHSDREEIWEWEKNRSQKVFCIVMREKEDAIKLADYIAEVIEEEFNEDLSST